MGVNARERVIQNGYVVNGASEAREEVYLLNQKDRLR